MQRCLLFYAFDVELRILIPNSFENTDPSVYVEYRNISERYQGAET